MLAALGRRKTDAAGRDPEFDFSSYEDTFTVHRATVGLCLASVRM